MKINKFRVAIYDWRVTLIQLESINDALEFKDVISKAAKNNHLSKSDISDLLNDCKKIKGGANFYSATSNHKALIILFRDQNYQEAINSICHEKRHLEDYILEKANIDDKEAAGYLAGYLSDKLLSLLIKKK